MSKKVWPPLLYTITFIILASKKYTYITVDSADTWQSKNWIIKGQRENCFRNILESREILSGVNFINVFTSRSWKRKKLLDLPTKLYRSTTRYWVCGRPLFGVNLLSTMYQQQGRIYSIPDKECCTRSVKLLFKYRCV